MYSKIIKNPKKEIFFNLKLKLNYINIKSLTNYIKLQLLKNWNFKKRFISVANKKYFTVKDLKMLKINFLPDTHSTNLVLEHKLIIPLKKKYFYPNKDNSLYEFIKKIYIFFRIKINFNIKILIIWMDWYVFIFYKKINIFYFGKKNPNE